MTSSQVPKSASSNSPSDSIEDLETRIAFLEDLVESLNQQLADINQEFSLAKQAMRLMNQRLEQVTLHSNGKSDAPEPPPPHY
jgi:SlyX protein